MRYIMSAILLFGTALAAIGQDTPVTIQVTPAQTNAVITRIMRINTQAVEAFVAANPGVVLSTNGVTVTGEVGGTPIGSMTLKTTLGYGREICSQALDGVVREEATIAIREDAEAVKNLAQAYRDASPSVKAQVRALLLP